MKSTAVPFITNFLLCLQIVKSVLCFVEGEISGWDRLEPMETLFHFSPLLSPKCPSRMDSPPIPSHQFFRLSLGDWKALPTFPLNSYFPILSGRNISISFYPLLKDPHGVSALHLLEFQSHILTYCVNLLPSDLSFGTKHPFLLLNLDHTSQPINLGDTPFLELDFQFPCPTSYPMDG